MIFISLCRAHINRGTKYKSKKILIIHLIIKELSQFFFNFAFGLRKLCPRHIRNIEALCSLLVNAKPEKLQKKRTREWHNGLHAYSVGLLSHICSQRFSQGLHFKTWLLAVPRFVVLEYYIDGNLK